MAVTLRKSMNGRHSDWWIGDTTVGGKRFRIHLIESRGSEGSQLFERTRKQAEAKYEQWVAEKKGESMSMGDAMKIAKSLTAIKIKSIAIDALTPVVDSLDIGEGTKRTYKNQVAVLKKWVNGDKTRTIGELSFDDVESFIMWMKNQSYKVTTINGVLIGLGSIFSGIHKNEKNPFRGHKVKADKMDEVVSREALTDEQIVKLIDYTREHQPKWCEIITFTLCTAMRKSDVCMLKWKYIDLKRGVIDFQNIKTGVRIVIPLFQKVREILASRMSANEDYGNGFNSREFVFPFFARWYSKGTSGLTTHLKGLMMKAFGDNDKSKEYYQRLKQFSVKGKVGRKRVSQYDFHALRTTAITNWVKKGVGVEVVVKMTGHKNIQTLMRHYNKTTAADFKDILSGTLPDCLRGDREAKMGEIKVMPWDVSAAKMSE